MFRTPNGKALRKGRTSAPGQIYLLTTVTRDRTPLFAGFDVGCRASRTLSSPSTWPDAQLLAWVLMPDHAHLLVALGESEWLARVMGRVKARISLVLKKEFGLSGIWQPGFHDHALRKDEDVRTAARYLVANPQRAGLAATAGAYPFWDATWLNPTTPAAIS